jgi:hypothetical protein
MFAALAQRALRLPADRILQSVASVPSSKNRFTWLASVSLGPANHYSTVALLCKQEGTYSGQRVRTYDCSFLKRYELSTPYEQIAADVRELFGDPRLHKATLVLERTAVGLPVLDLFRTIPARIVPLQLTGSAVKAEPDGRGGWIVPKVELTSLMQVLLAGRRPEDAQSALFAVADGLGEAAALLHAEWQSFTARVQLAVGKETSLVWRETANEDLCLAVACGCWVAEYCQRRLAIGI